MQQPVFTPDPLTDGIWSGALRASSAPARVVLIHHGAVLAEADVAATGDDLWRISVALPSSVLSDGMQTLLLATDENGTEVLDRLTVVAGKPLEQDILAEITLLRDELDLLKREFRRLATEV